MRTLARAAAATALALGAIAAVPGGARAAPELRRETPARPTEPATPVPTLPPEYLTHEGSFLRVAFHPSARERLRPALARLDTMREELVRLLGSSVPPSIDVRVAAVLGEADRIAPGPVPRGAKAATFVDQRLIVVFLEGRTAPELERDVRAAVASLALRVALGDVPLSRTVEAGFARAFAGHDTPILTLAGATLRRELRELDALEEDLSAKAPLADDDGLALAQAADLVRPLLEPSAGGTGFARLVERLRAGDGEEAAMRAATGGGLEALAAAQRRRLARDYAFFPALALVLAAAVIVRAAVRALRRRAELREVDRGRRFRSRRRRPSHQDDDRLPGPRVRSREGVPKVEHGGRWHTLH